MGLMGQEWVWSSTRRRVVVGMLRMNKAAESTVEGR
jgi:hypothetical protein